MKILQCGTWEEAEIINEEINLVMPQLLKELRKAKKIDYAMAREESINHHTRLIIKKLQEENYTFDIDSYNGFSVFEAIRGNIFSALNYKEE